MPNVSFFGYGANRDRKRIEEILRVEGLSGEDAVIRGGKGARIDGAVLAIQAFDQLPEDVKASILKVWGDKFRAYTLKTGVGQVAGVLWELTEKQYKALKDWELDGIWREMKEVEAITSDQKKVKVLTDKVKDDSAIQEIVDGLNYENNLNKKGMRDEREIQEDEYKIRELQLVREQLRGMALA